MGLDLSGLANELLLSLADTKDYVIAYETGETCDPDTGQCFPGTIEKIQLDSGAEDSAGFGLIDNTNIQAGDIFLMIAPKVELPTETFWFEVRGRRYSIIASTKVYNTGVLQYGEYQLRSS